VQRKVFRVEQMLADGRASAPHKQAAGVASPFKAQHERGGQRDAPPNAIKRELALAQDMIARNRRELGALIGEDKNRRLARAAGELGAAIAGMEKATHEILQQAEGVDERARTLCSTLKTDYERGLAQDIQDYAAKIYEACNFQDLAGQRIGKVIETLSFVEAQLAAMLARSNGQPVEAASTPASDDLINGPRLDGDYGHASQCDIDALFD
jgi:chemotaxis protein CheZ